MVDERPAATDEERHGHRVLAAPLTPAKLPAPTARLRKALALKHGVSKRLRVIALVSTL